jgi:1,4-dihydroxy-2-naphthoate octaprenyltransferase
MVMASKGVKTVGNSRNTGPALIPALQQTGQAELLWAVLVAVPLLLV